MSQVGRVVLGIVSVVIGIALLLKFGGAILLGIWNFILTILLAAWQFVLAVLQTGFSVFVTITTALIEFLATVGAIYIAFVIVLASLRSIAKQVREVGQDLQGFRTIVSEETRLAGRDATFISILGVLAAAIAYVATSDFMTELSTIKFLAVSSIGYCASKLFMLLPARTAKASGVFLTLAIFALSIFFLNHRYNIVGDATRGFPATVELLRGADPVKLSILGMIMILTAMSLLYPFSWTEWKRLLGWRTAAIPASLKQSASVEPRP